MVDALLAAGADVDRRNTFGGTALFVAVMNSYGRGAVIEQLLAAGADPDAENASGDSPRSMAQTIANHDVEQFFPDVGESLG